MAEAQAKIKVGVTGDAETKSKLKSIGTSMTAMSTKFRRAGIGMMAAGAALGEYPSPADAARELVRPRKTYEPDASRAAHYDERFEIYRDIYPTLRDISHRI